MTGRKIGIKGDTGNSGGAHLHLGLYQNNEDPDIDYDAYTGKYTAGYKEQTAENFNETGKYIGPSSHDVGDFTFYDPMDFLQKQFK